MSEFDLHEWFDPGELEPCPKCGESAGIRLPASGSLLCIACGHVRALPSASPVQPGRDDDGDGDD